MRVYIDPGDEILEGIFGRRGHNRRLVIAKKTSSAS
jgi:hypothetical protein